MKNSFIVLFIWITSLNGFRIRGETIVLLTEHVGGNAVKCWLNCCVWILWCVLVEMTPAKLNIVQTKRGKAVAPERLLARYVTLCNVQNFFILCLYFITNLFYLSLVTLTTYRKDNSMYAEFLVFRLHLYFQSKPLLWIFSSVPQTSVLSDRFIVLKINDHWLIHCAIIIVIRLFI